MAVQSDGIEYEDGVICLQIHSGAKCEFSFDEKAAAPIFNLPLSICCRAFHERFFSSSASNASRASCASSQRVSQAVKFSCNCLYVFCSSMARALFW